MRRVFRAAAGILLMLSALSLCLLYLPQLFGVEAYPVKTDTMAPAFPKGALSYIKRCKPVQIQARDCILFWQGDQLVLRRVLTVDGDNQVYITSGDALSGSDPPVPFSQVVGKAYGQSIPKLGHLCAMLSGADGAHKGMKIFQVLLLVCVIEAFVWPTIQRRIS